MAYQAAESRARQGFARNYVIANYFEGVTAMVALLTYIVVESVIRYVTGACISTWQNSGKDVKTIMY